MDSFCPRMCPVVWRSRIYVTFWSERILPTLQSEYPSAAYTQPTLRLRSKSREHGCATLHVREGTGKRQKKGESGSWGESNLVFCWRLHFYFHYFFFRLARVFFVLNNGDNYTFKGSHSKPLERLRNLIAGNHEKM